MKPALLVWLQRHGKLDLRKKAPKTALSFSFCLPVSSTPLTTNASRLSQEALNSSLDRSLSCV